MWKIYVEECRVELEKCRACCIAALNQLQPVNQPVSHSCIQLSNSIHLNTRALEIIEQAAFVETA